MEAHREREVSDREVAAEGLLEQGVCAQEWHRTQAQACRLLKEYP